MMACDVWLRRDFLIRHGRTPDEPPCGHDPQQCPPSDQIGPAMTRSLVNVDVSVEREDGIPTLHCLCDCGTLTHVVLANLASSIAANGLQFAFTCDNCQSSHWLTLTPTAYGIKEE